MRRLTEPPTERSRTKASPAVLVGAILTVVVLAAGACGNSKGTSASQGGNNTGPTGTAAGGSVAVTAPGVSATEIRVGGVASVTNPLGGNYGDIFKGVQAYFDMVNAKGGIYGRKLVLSAQLDDHVGNNQQAVTQLLTQENVFAVMPVAVLLFSGADKLVQANVPTFGWTINPEWQGTAADPRLNMFGETGSYLGPTDASPVLPWLAERLNRHKIGVLAYTVAESAQCAEGVKNSFAKYGKAADADVVFTDKSLNFGVTSLAPQVSQMKSKGVDLVTTCMDTNGVVTLAKEMKKQQLDAIQYLPDAYDHKFVQTYGDLFENSVVRTDFTAFELPSSDQPAGLKNYLEWIKKQNVTPSEDSMNGWLNADLFYNGLKAAGPNFSRQKLIDAINKMKLYTADGAVAGVDWTVAHTSPTGSFCQFFSTIEHSTFVTNYSKPGKPFVCISESGGKLTAEYVKNKS
jgi:ABC-type branched-subunit amino acid transport system substrate-binding protein